MLTKCMFSGSGGQGSALMAKLVCLAAIREGLKVVMTQTYGIEQRGGTEIKVSLDDGGIAVRQRPYFGIAESANGAWY